MGNSNSSTIKQTADIANQVVTNIVNSSVTSGEAKSLNVQKFILRVAPGGKIKGCNIQVGQEITSDQALKVFSTFESASQISTLLENVIEQTSQQSQEAISNFISLAKNANESNAELVTRLKNEVMTNVKNENITKCNAFVQNLQNGIFLVEGEIECSAFKPTIEFNQKIVNKQVVDCISQTLFNTVASTDIFNKVKQKAESEQKTEDKGPFGFLKDLIWPIVIGGIILLILAGIGVAIFFVYNKQDSTKVPSKTKSTGVKSSSLGSGLTTSSLDSGLTTSSLGSGLTTSQLGKLPLK